jgi:hypothetical protein
MILCEKDLQFIWKNNFFDKTKLKTTTGEYLEIISNGFLNINSGPDFTNAHIRINNVDLFGSIEIHKYSSDWMLHKHYLNESYENVILHVVFEEDIEIFTNKNIRIPTLVLNGLINSDIIKNVQILRENDKNIFCKDIFNIEINYEELIKHRICSKFKFIRKLLNDN